MKRRAVALLGLILACATPGARAPRDTKGTPMNAEIAVGQILELIRFKVPPEKAASFLGGRPAVDEFVHSLAGHLGTEIVQLGPEDWLLLIRWVDEPTIRAAQKVTETSPVIQSWLTEAGAEFVSFETTSVRYVRY